MNCCCNETNWPDHYDGHSKEYSTLNKHDIKTKQKHLMSASKLANHVTSINSKSIKKIIEGKFVS